MRGKDSNLLKIATLGVIPLHCIKIPLDFQNEVLTNGWVLFYSYNFPKVGIPLAALNDRVNTFVVLTIFVSDCLCNIVNSIIDIHQKDRYNFVITTKQNSANSLRGIYAKLYHINRPRIGLRFRSIIFLFLSVY